MARQPLDSQRICAEILMGHHDEAGDDIFHAILQRAAEAGSRLRWRGKWQTHDLVVTEDDLTLDECMAVERFAKIQWYQLDPLESAQQAAAILIVTLNRRRDVPIDDATKQVGALGYRAVLDMFDRYFVEASPLDQAGEVVDEEGNARPLS